MNKPREFWILLRSGAINGQAYVSEQAPESRRQWMGEFEEEQIHVREVLPIPQSVEAEIEREAEKSFDSKAFIWNEGNSPKSFYETGFKSGYELAMRMMK